MPFPEDLSLFLFHGSNEVMSNDSPFALSLRFVLIIDHHKGISSPGRVLPSCLSSAVFSQLSVSTSFGICKEGIEMDCRGSVTDVEMRPKPV